VGDGPNAIAVLPNGRTAYVADANDGTVTPIAIKTLTAGTPITVGGNPIDIAITPDQAPVAQIHAGDFAPGSPTPFDAFGSSVAYGTITHYTWRFGDGVTVRTTVPTVQHLYTESGSFTATVTETSSAGTALKRVFTGHTMIENGGPSARASTTVIVPT
jgi:hypothetical protein